MAKADGGPAFPAHWMNDEYGHERDNGMSLRDYFAGQALNGFITAHKDGQATEFQNAEHVASWCYEWADAMLKAREQ